MKQESVRVPRKVATARSMVEVKCACGCGVPHFVRNDRYKAALANGQRDFYRGDCALKKYKETH